MSEVVSGKLLLFVGIGGMIGAIGRYCITLLFSEPGFPVATLLVNLLGCFLLTYLLNHQVLVRKFSKEMMAALTTGLIGSFTTFSTFALETMDLIIHRSIGLATLYFTLSLVGGILCCFAGLKLTNRRRV